MNAVKTKKLMTPFYAATIVLTLTALYPTTVAAATSNNYRTFAAKKASFQTNKAIQTKEMSSDDQAITVGDISPEEKAMVKLINQERMEAGLDELEIDLTLVSLAREKSLDMVNQNYFGHNSEKLGTIDDQLQRAGVIYGKTAENLSGAPNCFKAQYYLMHSPGHRSNILNPKFKKIGIGIIQGGPYGKMITQIFLG